MALSLESLVYDFGKKSVCKAYVSEQIHHKNFFKSISNNQMRGVDMIKEEKKTVNNITIPEIRTLSLALRSGPQYHHGFFWVKMKKGTRGIPHM